MMERREECWRLLGVPPTSSLSRLHFRLTGPSGLGRSVIGESERRLVRERRVGELLGEGENDKFGTGIYKKCLY